MNRSQWSLALFALAIFVLPIRSLAAPMPGSVPGLSLNFTISEQPDLGPDTVAEPPVNFTFNVPVGSFAESGSLLLCEPGTACDPADTQNHLNWSDVIQWAGGNCNAGVCTGTFYSDPTTFPDLSLPFGQGTIVMPEVADALGNDGAVYQANDGTGMITTWTIQSDVVPEPSSMGLVGLGLALLSCRCRFARA